MNKKNENNQILFQNDSKRDVAMIKTFLSFVNRVKNPNTSMYFFIFGIAAMLMPVFTDQKIVSKIGFVLGCFSILMAFFRQYIPLTIMKRRDPDYIEGATISCRFTAKGFKVYRNDEEFIDVASYSLITGLYEDEQYFYISVNNDDLLVLPKNDFSIGDWNAFKSFIAKERALAFVWIPASFINKAKEIPGRIRMNLDRRHAYQESKKKEILLKEQQKRAAKKNQKSKK